MAPGNRMRTAALLLRIADELDLGARAQARDPRAAPFDPGMVAAAIRRAVASDLSVQRLRMQNECGLHPHAPTRGKTDEP